ncbi:MAG: hypothetical protein PHV36_03450 [Elusimicrobiales bacterium]|nr:hypothetical protein [Elusimicrobiales bacterium]
MKKYGILTLVIGLLALAASFGRAALSETAQNKVAAIAQQSGFADTKDLNSAVPATAPGAVAAAGEPVVAITSFVMTGQNTRVAEICGKVTGTDAEVTVVRIVVDPKTNNPGTYNTLAGKDGAFCSVVVTYTGTASASVKALGKESASAVVTASKGYMR